MDQTVLVIFMLLAICAIFIVFISRERVCKRKIRQLYSYELSDSTKSEEDVNKTVVELFFPSEKVMELNELFSKSNSHIDKYHLWKFIVEIFIDEYPRIVEDDWHLEVCGTILRPKLKCTIKKDKKSKDDN